ncbi:hypothetical protein M9458_002243, partial [Cirrhinus mrigala]
RPRHAHALFDFTSNHATHLRFLRGDVIDLLDCSDAHGLVSTRVCAANLSLIFKRVTILYS